MKMMSKANRRNISGILLLNKPGGCTSNHILQKVKWMFNAKKAGHTGSLDPLATGMLPICFGDATKFSHYLLNADKSYDVSAQLGIKTNTADSTGEIMASVDSFDITEADLLTALEQFKGTTKQIPSMYSALKHQGIPLYKYARAGIDIARDARDISIKSLQLNAYDGKIFDLSVRCSKGTYIRNLVEDIGEVLGVGAHVTRLHRTYTSGFETDRMYSFDELECMIPEELDTCILPMDRSVEHLSFIELQPCELAALMQGKVIPWSNSVADERIVRLYDQQKAFWGLGKLDVSGTLKVKRLVNTATV